LDSFLTLHFIWNKHSLELLRDLHSSVGNVEVPHDEGELSEVGHGRAGRAGADSALSHCYCGGRDWGFRNLGNQEIRKSGNQEIKKSGNQEIRKSGNDRR
jgi:hypothetical protein